MGINIGITDEIFGNSKLSIFELSYPSEKVTIREIITRRVEKEVARVNYKKQDPNGIKAEHSMFLAGLTEISPEVLLNADIKRKKAVNSVSAVETALEAFEAGRFFIFFNDNQYETLEAKVTLTPNSEIVFPRITPLMGG